MGILTPLAYAYRDADRYGGSWDWEAHRSSTGKRRMGRGDLACEGATAGRDELRAALRREGLASGRWWRPEKGWQEFTA